MAYITYAPVDRQFRTLERDLPPGAPFNQVDPVEGITFGFAQASRYPLAAGVPDIRFGTVASKPKDDPAILLRSITKAEYDAAEAAEMAARDVPVVVTSADVNAERDRRIRSGFMFAGAPFDYDDSSQKRITGAATLAGFAAAAGAQPGDLRWHGGAEDFVWIAQDNSLMPMDAPTCFTFGQAAAAWESANVFAAKAIKDSGIPANYADDALWPA